jgi:phosphatidylinositol-3,4,5-trisphosphate 3-phosphatase/dual-specificity protein phosphatase PTEN
MFNFVRKIVAGPKNRTIDEEYDLDLTYITERLIAMAFPAAGFEKTYRNSINDVCKFFKERHG